MTGEEKKTITREKHPGRIAQGHELTALIKKRKEEILRSKEKATERSTEQSTAQSTEQYTEQSSVRSTEQSSVQSDGDYVYGVGMLAALAIGACVFCAYNISLAENKKQANEKKDQSPKRRHML